MARYFAINPTRMFEDKDIEDEITAESRHDDQHRKVGKALDLLFACLIVIVPLGLLHFFTKLLVGDFDPSDLLIYDFQRSDWGSAVVESAVLLLWVGFFVWFIYVLLRSRRLKGL